MLKLKSSLRENIGTNESRRLRKAGMVPAVVYGKGKETKVVQLKHSDIFHAQNNGTLFHSVLQLDIDNSTEKVIVKDLQRHPFKPLIQHIDFMYVSSKEKVVLNINIEIKGEEEVLKRGLMVVNSIASLDVSCLPTKLPDSIVIDVSAMEAGDKVNLGDIKPPKGVTFVALESDQDAADRTVLSISYPDTKEPEEPTESEEEPEQ